MRVLPLHLSQRTRQRQCAIPHLRRTPACARNRIPPLVSWRPPRPRPSPCLKKGTKSPPKHVKKLQPQREVAGVALWRAPLILASESFISKIKFESALCDELGISFGVTHHHPSSSTNHYICVLQKTFCCTTAPGRRSSSLWTRPPHGWQWSGVAFMTLCAAPE